MKKIMYGVAACLLLALGACDDDEETPLSINFRENSGSDSEAGSSTSAILQLNQAAGEDIEIEYNVSGNAILNGDYRFTPPPSSRILSGNTTLEFVLEPIDDPVIEEEDKIIEINITGVTGLTLPDDEPLLYTFTITDNDELPDNGLQIDLTWNLGIGEDIDEVNLDLLLATDVVVEGDAITGFTLDGNSSENTEGFESILLDNGAPDNEYYLVIFYNSGSREVTFDLSLHSLGSDSSTSTGSFTKDDVGSAVFFGPIVKDGSFTSDAARALSEGFLTGKYPFIR